MYFVLHKQNLINYYIYKSIYQTFDSLITLSFSLRTSSIASNSSLSSTIPALALDSINCFLYILIYYLCINSSCWTINILLGIISTCNNYMYSIHICCYLNCLLSAFSFSNCLETSLFFWDSRCCIASANVARSWFSI